ncbi:1-acyl-sn-glycerol-3-phosphate acyltransferase [Phenylobacterium sp.]|uniref:1-acyl-sn-glycerol-3-phosphate acyltransferase n=1 Tax=Phenylobacterium sp. TaxID=1871053 RepID=UPI0025D373A8|nr:1-acyl-sn-glycerol-3-phosphate acyltransferase [Phenylobacterium sp.]MBX3482776.1 1-acyl-sn-glycerol-3-phosphate acyltransferase [Phenylobacterium sp.]MCW5759874.1 1-acyl-sn-glycerol-3-phosphate acyltransferase [Phenylobacterium sp.]
MTVATAAAAKPARARDHIVDVLIAERAPRLSGGPAWPLLRPLLYAILDYGKARRMADAIAVLPGRAALDHISGLLALKVTATGLDRVPRTGRLVVICNHPTGIADGIAVFDALKPLRPDICFYANADAHRVCPDFGEVLIPVEWVDAKRTREKTRVTLQATREALEAERCLAIFPAGRLARRQPDGSLSDPTWMSSAISIARKYEAPVLPIHVAGPWSTLFHLFHGRSDELRDITLFHELLNKRGRAFALTVGPAIPAGALDGDPAEATARLKAYVERGLPADRDRAFA